MYRKSSLRLAAWNYTSPGPYFVTVCTANRRPWFSDEALRGVVIDGLRRAADELSVHVHDMVVASDHLHALVTLPGWANVDLGKWVGRGKVLIGRRLAIGYPEGGQCPPLRRFWQNQFYDHVIRNDEDFRVKAQYIVNHPFKEPGFTWSEWH